MELSKKSKNKIEKLYLETQKKLAKIIAEDLINKHKKYIKNYGKAEKSKT